MKLSLLRKIKENDECYTFVFANENNISWKAGQYMQYTLPHEPMDDRGDKRWFSISSAPSEKEIHLTTRITAEKGSSFKKALLALQPGEEITADTPEGDFILDTVPENIIFVAGGIGITPYRAILKDLQSRSTPMNITLLYANRSLELTTFKDELETIKSTNPGLRIDYFFGERFITKEDLKKAALRFVKPIFYVSGPEPMVEAFKKTLQEIGIDDEHSRFDYFPGYSIDLN